MVKSIFQNGTGANVIVIVNQVAGNTQSANHFATFCIKMLIVVVNIPVNSFIYGQVNARVVQGCDARHNYGRTVSLCSTTFQEAFSIFQENFHRNFFVSIVTSEVHTHQGNKLNFRVHRQNSMQISFVLLFRFNVVKQIFFVHG